MMTFGLRLAALLPLLALVILGEPPGDAEAAFFSTDVPGDTDCDGDLTAGDALGVFLNQAHVAPDALCLIVGNVLCEDQLQADDGLAILGFLGGILPQLPGRCFEPGGPVQSEVVSDGTTTIHGTFLFDFDMGVESPAPGTDVWWHIESSDPFVAQLEPDHGAGLAVLLNTDFGTLNVVALNATPYTDAAINGSEGAGNLLANGSVFAVLTDQGNYAKVRVIQYGQNLQIEWVTYEE